MTFWRKRKHPEQEEQPDSWEPRPVLDAPVIMIGRKELYECGFEFCGDAIRAAYESANLQVVLDDEREPPDEVDVDDDAIIRWLWINERFLIEDINVDVEFQLATGEIHQSRALDWDFVMALRACFDDPHHPERNWQLGEIDEGYLLILARPDQLDAIEAHPDFVGYRTTDLTGATEIRRGEFW